MHQEHRAKFVVVDKKKNMECSDREQAKVTDFGRYDK